jgi:hypothetical protein
MLETSLINELFRGSCLNEMFIHPFSESFLKGGYFFSE